MASSLAARTPKILIFGGGYLGLSVARNLERYTTQLDVTVVEPNGYPTYQPLLPWVAGGHVDPRDVWVELDRVLMKARIIRASLVSLDSVTKTAVLERDSKRMTEHYDQVVMPIGAVTRTVPTSACKGKRSASRRSTMLCATETSHLRVRRCRLHRCRNSPSNCIRICARATCALAAST